MITGWPNCRLIASATGRATVSATPPGGKGTTIVMVLEGHLSCAKDGIEEKIPVKVIDNTSDKLLRFLLKLWNIVLTFGKELCVVIVMLYKL
jgi:hypothetical protein